MLKNIFSIKLKDEIDEKTFNKLAKWAINTECRMKNIKTLELCDRFDSQELIKNRSKTLKFGQWR